MKRTFSVIVILAVGFGAGYFTANTKSPSFKSPHSKEIRLDLSQTQKVWERIQDKYVDIEHIDKKTLSYGLAKGLVRSLGDPYSAYLTPEETELFQSSLNSELEGIGAELTLQNEQLVVVSPLKGSPAEKAGLEPGDIIIKINGTNADDFSFTDAIGEIRGPKGTTVKLQIFREQSIETLDFEIVRDEITIDSVVYEKFDDGIEYISINQFSDDTEKEFFNAVRKVLLNDSKGLILDLRFNGGGYLDTSVDILGEFIERGKTAVIVESGAEKTRETLKTSGSARLKDIPLVVLINQGSASASEILAGALQDYERATVVGTTSFGKGTVQEVELLNDGSSLRLTIAKWLTPAGRYIEEKGVVPDVVVSPIDSADGTQDSQLEKAKEILLNRPD